LDRSAWRISRLDRCRRIAHARQVIERAWLIAEGEFPNAHDAGMVKLANF
jgi:hypothetical protein